MNIQTIARKLLFMLAASAIVSVLALGQATDSNVVGIVTDPSDAIVPNATVTATNQATGVQYIGTSNAAGEYRINNVPVGTYDVEASATGMAGNKVTGVVLELNRTASVNFKLQLGTVSTVVEVVEAAALVDTSTSQLQTAFNSGLSINLPAAGNYLHDTGVLNLSLLAPGVAQSASTGFGTGPSVGGQRPTSNSFNIDGVDNNAHDVTGPLALVPNDSVAQFSILTNQFSPEFGGAAGGIFNTVVKSGSNELHGSLYEYFNNRNLNAIDSLKAVQGFRSNPRFDYNRFGGTVGGPIKQNKLFYFANWEYSVLGEGATPGAPIQAPTAAGYQTLQALPGISKANLGVLQQYLSPAPAATGAITVTGVSIPIGRVNVVGPSYVNKQNVVGAGDWNISDNDQLRVRYFVNRYSGIDKNAQLPAFYSRIPNNRTLVTLSEFHTFNATTISEFRASYSRANGSYPVGDFRFPGLDQFPNLVFTDLNLQMGPDSATPQGYIQGALQATENISKTWGHHTFKAGYQFQDIIATNAFVQRARGDYQYSTLDLYLRDLSPDVLGSRSVGVAGGLPMGYLFHALYFNDDYRIKPNLTLNLGLRYEYMTVPVILRYQALSSAANVPGLLTFDSPKSQKNNWGPRVGIAWSPGKDNVWSIRAGFGINYDQPYSNLFTAIKPAYFSQTKDVPSLTNNTPKFLEGGGLLPSNEIVLTQDPVKARAAVSGYFYDQIRPYSVNWTVGIQRSLGKDYTLEARYVGTKGVHLYVQEQINRITNVTPSYSLPTLVTAPSATQLAGLNLTLGEIRSNLVSKTNFPASPSNSYAQHGFTSTITAYHPIGNSEYNGLSLQLNKRYARNFSYLTAFTWSHALDDSTATVNTTVLSPRRAQDGQNLRNEWASSALDRRLRFTFTPMYDVTVFARSNWMMKNIVGNWNVSATYTYQSPAYATVQSNIDANLNADAVGDRSVVNPAGNARVSSTVTAIDKTGATVAAGSASIVGYVAQNPNARYIQAGQGAYANAGRNTFPLNPINNIDLQLMKRLAITERIRVELAGQFNNLLNHPQWTGDLLNDVYPNFVITSRNSLLTGNPNFGRFDQFYTSNSRVVSVVGRFVF